MKTHVLALLLPLALGAVATAGAETHYSHGLPEVLRRVQQALPNREKNRPLDPVKLAREIDILSRDLPGQLAPDEGGAELNDATKRGEREGELDTASDDGAMVLSLTEDQRSRLTEAYQVYVAAITQAVADPNRPDYRLLRPALQALQAYFQDLQALQSMKPGDPEFRNKVSSIHQRAAAFPN